jgi:hypothetical protein
MDGFEAFSDAFGTSYSKPVELAQRPRLPRTIQRKSYPSKKPFKMQPVESSQEDDFDAVLRKKKINALKRKTEALKYSSFPAKKKKEESPAKYGKLQKEILINLKEPFLQLPEEKEEEKIKYPLSDSVVTHVKRLRGVLPTGNEPRRHATHSQKPIPREIQFFLDIKWPTKKSLGEPVTLKVKNDDFQVYSLEFVEYDLLEWDTYKFLKDHPDACLIGDGNVILVTLLSQDNLADFDVYLLDDDDLEGAEGPFRISEFLSKTVLDDGIRVK